MSNLIIGVVMDVVLHFILNNLQGVRVGFIATAARNFVILGAAEFVVLNPKIGLDKFQRCWKPEQCRVSWCETAANCFCRAGAAQQPHADCSCSSGERSPEERPTTEEALPRA